MIPPSAAAARWMIVAAAVLWSSSSVFIRAIQQPTFLNVDQPALSPLQIAFYRSLFAGLVLLPLVRRRQRTWRPSMAGMVFAFGTMTALYLSALGLGSAANAILLQNTAPVWVYFLGVYILKDTPDTRSLCAVMLAMAGALTIVIGNWPRKLDATETKLQTQILLMAAGSGVFYAIVVLFLRHLRSESAAWLTVLNLLGGSVVVAAFAMASLPPGEILEWFTVPSLRQLSFIALYGIIQLALPYVLFTQGLKSVSPQEAGILTLIEPLLNPLWAYLIAPDKETPTLWTFSGGSLILAALAWRYWPRRVTPAASC